MTGQPVPPGKADGRDRVSFERRGRLHDDTAHGEGNLFPDHCPAGGQSHVPAQLCRDGNLASSRDGRFHPIKVSLHRARHHRHPHGAALRLYFQPDGLGKLSLALVKGQEYARLALQGGGDVEQVDCALAIDGGVFLAQGIRSPQNVSPV